MSTTQVQSIATTTSAPSQLAKGGAIGAALALVASLIVYLVGNLGDPIRVIIGDGDVQDLPIGAVVVASVLPVLVGAAGLWVLQRFLARGFVVWAILVAVFAVVSIAGPLGLDVDNGSRVALAVMHLAVGGAAVAGQILARRGRS